jgi:DNA-binding NtrC family response regulator
MSPGPAILLVEDHAQSRESLRDVLERHGRAVLAASNGRMAIGIARKERIGGMILDLKLPDMDGLSVLDEVLALSPGVPAIVVTAYATVDSAVEAMKRGAVDFLTKPIRVDALLKTLDRCLERVDPSSVSTPADAVASQMERLGIVTRSRAMHELCETLSRVAPHQSTVLVLGESGTGKELIARALHALGPRASGPFVPVNCATLSEAILESELFGHERGAFTSADQAKAGLMETADRGTLFLDEVSEMRSASQAKLLRAIERREFRRVGGTHKVKVDFNLIAASNVDLEPRVEEGRFRADLYYRLKVVTLRVPPLRERGEGIPVLAAHFLDDAAKRAGLAPKRLTPEATSWLTRYAWPGNVRELRNAMESLTLLVPRPVVQVEDLPQDIRGAATGEIRLPISTRMSDAEREIIRRALAHYPTIKEAARALGIGLRTLHTKIHKYGLRSR